MRAPRLSVVVVSYNTRPELLRCLESLDRVTLPKEVLVVDNASSDGSPEAVASLFPQVSLLRSPENVGFSRANNLALRQARGELVLLLNSDAEVRPGAVEALAGVLERRTDAAAVGPRTVEADGTVQVSFGPRLTPVREWRQRRLVKGVERRRPGSLRRAGLLASEPREPDWVSAACVLLRREALDAVGGFDEDFFLYEEDVDLCLRLRKAGWRVLYTPAAEVVHHRGRSVAAAARRAQLEYHRSHLRYYRKHNGRVLTAALRGWLVLGGAWRWLTAGGGRRAEQKDLIRLALRGA